MEQMQYVDEERDYEGGADLEALDDYVEMLYDELPKKIEGSMHILQLARDADNLQLLVGTVCSVVGSVFDTEVYGRFKTTPFWGY